MVKCEEVLKQLYDYIDRQLDSVSIAEIEEHIELCRFCRRYHDFEVELRNMVQKCCFQKKAPELLKNKISEMLGEIEPE